MEVQLQELIDQIKKDGVTTAETEAENIINTANAQAEKIIADAKSQAERLLHNAKTENEKVVKSGEDALTQAGRNLLISLRESVSRELNAVIGEKVANVYSSDTLSSIIVNVIENWAKNPDCEDITVILNSADLAKLQGNLLSALKEKMIKGVTLKANDNFDGGFRISTTDGGAYYDYSREAVVDMLSNYLSPKVTALLKEAE